MIAKFNRMSRVLWLGASLSLGQTVVADLTAFIGGTAGTAWLARRVPSHEIQEILYFGVIDPQEQLPVMLYRLTVRAQSSPISGKKFAAGWVHANLIDTLNSWISLDADRDNAITFQGVSTNTTVRLNTGRRLVMFGPLGFREFPRNHRLVLMLSASPEEFFKAVDNVLVEAAPALAKPKGDKTAVLEEVAANRKDELELIKIENEYEALQKN